MSKLLPIIAITGAPVGERLGCGLLDTHCGNGLSLARTILSELGTGYNVDQYYTVKGGTLGALCTRYEDSAKTIAILDGRNLDLETRNKEITGRLADWVMWSIDVLGFEEPNNSIQRAAINTMMSERASTIDATEKQRDELLAMNKSQFRQLEECAKENQDLKRQIGSLQTSMGDMAITLAHYKQLSEDLKTGTDVDQGRIQNRDGIIEEQKAALRTWRKFARVMATERFGIFPADMVSDDQLIKWIVSNVEQMAKTIAANTVDHVELAELKEQNHRQGNTITNYQESTARDRAELSNWRNWALTQFGLSGDNKEIRAGIDDYCQTLALGHVALVDKAADLEQTAKDLAHLNATQKDEIDNLNALKVLDGNCIDKLRDSLAYHRNNLADLRDGLLDNHNLKTTDWTSVHEAMKVIRRCACRTQNNGQIPCASGTVVINNARIASQEVDGMNLVSAKSVKFNPSAAATKVVISPEYAAAIRDIVRSEIDGAIKAIISGA